MRNASVYSFVGWLSSIFVYICFLMWAYLPEELLHLIGICDKWMCSDINM